MEAKYKVPALEKADKILRLIADEPDRLKLIELSRRTGIHKSSMFSLLKTMENLGWIVSGKDSAYSLGPVVGTLGSLFFRQQDFIGSFLKEASAERDALEETLQLATLDRGRVLYLAKLEAPSPVKLVSEPGMTYPAHATALGKALLAFLPDRERERLFPEERLEPLTAHTHRSTRELFADLAEVRRRGVAEEVEEAVVGFACVAAPVKDLSGDAAYAVSVSLPLHRWQLKKELCRERIAQLGARLSELLQHST